MFCSKCGRVIKDGDVFCIGCGTKLDEQYKIKEENNFKEQKILIKRQIEKNNL